MMGLWEAETTLQNEYRPDAHDSQRDGGIIAAHSAMTKERQQCDTRSTNTMTESPRVHSEAACLRNPPQESPKLTYERPLMSDISKRPLPTPRSLSKHAASGATSSRAWDYQQVYPASYPEQSTQLAESGRPNIGHHHLVRVKEGLAPDMKIFKLPYAIAHSLENELDRGDWKKLVMASENTRFSLNYSQISRLEDCRMTESPGNWLLMRYATLGMTVHQLLELLATAKLESAMELLRRPEPLKITKQPKEYVDLEEGQMLTLTCEAVGFPRPRYQWFSYQNGAMRKLPDQTLATLSIRSIRKDQAGNYVCQVHNSARLNFPQSSWSTITVKPQTRPVPAPRQLTPNLFIVRQTQFAQLTVYQGQWIQLECEAHGRPPPRYQWYRDTTLLPGQDQPLLNLLILNSSFSGNYVCIVTNGTTLQSNPIYVTVIVAGAGGPPPTPAPRGVNFGLGQIQNPQQPQHTAQAKVALLIGTEKYHVAHEPLPAARNDVLLLEKHLKDMDFMVVTLLDLKKDELIQHVKWFCELLDKGVYGLFFYIGHGFDHSHQSFLIPWDASINCPTKDCVHLQKDILRPILLADPAMCLAIIDICRLKSKTLSEDDKPEDVILPANGSTCIFYTTSPGQESYEHKDTELGIFMMHLSKVIGEKISVQELHSRVLAEIKHDPAAGLCQYPMIESNLNATYSLHDPINYKGFTQIMNRRREIWETAQNLPREHMLTIPHAGFSVRITFEKVVSNAMKMSVNVVQKGTVNRWHFKVDDVPPQITGYQNFNQETGKFHTIFEDLQRLQEPLRVRLVVTVSGNIFEKELDLGMPLVSSLHLHALECEREAQRTTPGTSNQEDCSESYA